MKMKLTCMCCGGNYQGSLRSYYCSQQCKRKAYYIIDCLFHCHSQDRDRIGEFLTRSVEDWEEWERLAEFDPYLTRPIKWANSCLERLDRIIGYEWAAPEFLLHTFRPHVYRPLQQDAMAI